MDRTSLNESINNGVISLDEHPHVDYKMIMEIGRGASCVVYHAIGSDNTEHLLKEYLANLQRKPLLPLPQLQQPDEQYRS